METPKISIIIPSFNKFQHIAQTLDSIVNQKYSNLEVIIQDGGSTDGTLEIIKKYVHKYPKIIKYKSGKDGGQLNAINIGFGRAGGEILGYINADDVYERNSFQTVAEFYREHPEAFWFAGKGKVINSSGKEITKLIILYKNFLLSLNTRFYLLITNYLMQPSVFITQRAWKKCKPFIGTREFVTEYDFWLRLSKFCMPIVIDKVISSFRIELGTITKNLTKKLLREDENIVRRYTSNIFIISIHKLHNFGRVLVEELT